MPLAAIVQLCSLGGEYDEFSSVAMSAMTPAEAVEHVVTTNPTFAVHEVDVRGVTFKAFKNIPGTVPGLLTAGWAQHGEGTLEYLAYESDSYTYAEFTQSVNQLAHAMRDELGLGQGDRVAIAMRNYPELLMLVLAISSMGGVVVFLNAWWTTKELDYALRDSGAKVVFADGPRLERMTPLRDDLGLTIIGVRDGEGQSALNFTGFKDGAASDVAPEVEIDTDDDFAVMYSSGTTGHPKGVVQTH
ncbi:class I adenylate-forming enzyme family protein, partial [Planktotalea sp.]|uniref:class I adenylate-forming enzyme family protein n=1 Tax=Planktotalea sp. TaxID=2029877 RepID=UPI003297ADB9